MLALRDALELDISPTATNAEMAQRIAYSLRIPWEAGARIPGTRVPLQDLNELLFGTVLAREQGRLPAAPVREKEARTRKSWLVKEPARGSARNATPPTFRPAQSKQEALDRITNLTGAPAETLGPGSKEHKSLLVNLAAAVALDMDANAFSKTSLAKEIAEHLGAHWSDHFVSTGETIRLDGLNVLLAATEWYFRPGSKDSGSEEAKPTPRREAALLVNALGDQMRDVGRSAWDGKEKVLWLRDNETGQEKQMEWPGWYFDFRGRQVLAASFEPVARPPKVRYGNTTFDYSRHYVWDLKCHTGSRLFPLTGEVRTNGHALMLNDANAAEQCIARGGLGFIILVGEATMDQDGRFKEWHDKFKGGQRTPSLSGRSRLRKSAFLPRELRAYWFADQVDLDQALATGALERVSQGRQQSGASRPDKLILHLDLAGKWLVSRKPWDAKSPA